MMNRRLFWMLLVLVLTAGAALAQAPNDTDSPGADETITGIVSEEGSFVTAGPDFAYPVVAQLPIDASVTVIGRSGDFITQWNGTQWLQIVYGETKGWIYARLVRTSIRFNAIPPTGRLLPRDRNGRVPEVFDLSTFICDRWTGAFTQSGDFTQGSTEIVVTYPEMPGATIYSVITFAPSGQRVAFDSETTTATILLEDLPGETGTYTWRVAPYWTNDIPRYTWQQLCLLQTGGTFERPPQPTPTPPPATP